MPVTGHCPRLDQKRGAVVQFTQNIIAVGAHIGHEESAKTNIYRQRDNDADHCLPEDTAQPVKEAMFQYFSRFPITGLAAHSA